jgi:hypothetical protein
MRARDAFSPASMTEELLTSLLGNDDLSLPKGSILAFFSFPFSSKNIIVITPVILLCSMSLSHQFVTKDYKDSWNDGPPWPECNLCHQDGPSDANLVKSDKQAGPLGRTLVQNPEFLSPRAPVFHPSGHQSYHFGGHRPYRSLPSRRGRGHILAQFPTSLAPHHRACPALGLPTAHYPALNGVKNAANFIRAHRSNPRPRYLDFQDQGRRRASCIQMWNSLSAKDQAKLKQTSEDIHRTTEENTGVVDSSQFLYLNPR